MVFGKTIVIASLLVMICSAPANAWGKREQGFLLGAATVLTLPHLINHNRHYDESARYYNDGYYRYAPNTAYRSNTPTTVVNIEQNAPEVIYIERDDGIPMHRKVKTHNYINNKQVDHIIIERKITVVNR
ncbi:MAG: hypothetical protein LBC08_02535 [Campylobacteraceae bacterium]|jgi:hypothetical protein|nr:hypothetical protein [Campylobacteraceae bacterium]